jgi:hypothetical protein
MGSAAAFGIGGLLTQELYELLLVPWLSYFDAIPLLFKLAVLLPQAIAILAVAWTTRTAVGFLMASTSGGLAHHLLFTWLAYDARPGHHKSLALEASDSWWTTELAISIAFSTACFAFCCTAIRAWHLVQRSRLRHR